MGREIKFRAWNGSEMLDVHSLDLKGDDRIHFNHQGEKCTMIKNPEAVMQYTGLKDKNGKEIYEGDIVQYGGLIWCADYHKENNPSQTYQEIKTAEVCYIGTSFIARLFEFEDGYPLSTLEIHKDFSGFNVIGNIYENPELLEKNHD